MGSRGVLIQLFHFEYDTDTDALMKVSMSFSNSRTFKI